MFNRPNKCRTPASGLDCWIEVNFSFFGESADSMEVGAQHSLRRDIVFSVFQSVDEMRCLFLERNF